MIPKQDDFITNSNESKRLPDNNPVPLTGTKKKEVDSFDTEYEGKEVGGNAAAKTEEQARKLDGSNANSLRTK